MNKISLYYMLAQKCEDRRDCYASSPNQAYLWELLNTSGAFYGTSGAVYYEPGTLLSQLDPGWKIQVSTPVYSPDVQDCAGVFGGSAFLDKCNNCVGGTTGAYPCYVELDCAGVPNGTAYIDSCKVCVGGTTGLLPCEQDCAGIWGGSAINDTCHTCAGGTTGIPRCDTVKPQKVMCDSLAIANGNQLKEILDNPLLEPSYVQRLIDSSLQSRNESGASISEVIFRGKKKYEPYNFQSGSGSNVEVITYDPAHNLVAGIHTHPAGKSNTPSTADLYHLIEGYMSNNNYFADYIFAYEDSVQIAIMITDTALAGTFLNTYPKDSTLEAPPNNGWSNFVINPLTGRTFYWDHIETMKDLFYNQHYPLSMVQTYANVRMFGELNTGVKMFIKQDGAFKELSHETTTDANGIEHTKIIICQ